MKEECNFSRKEFSVKFYCIDVKLKFKSFKNQYLQIIWDKK